MNDSKFNLWRATFSFCFIDGSLSPEEISFIEDKLKTLPLAPEQRNTLMGDIKGPPKLEELLPLITAPADRGILVNNIRYVSQLDGLSELEKKKIDAIKEKVLSRVDLSGLNEVIAAEEISSYHESEVYKVHNKASFIESSLRAFQKALNPGDYKFPKK